MCLVNPSWKRTINGVIMLGNNHCLSSWCNCTSKQKDLTVSWIFITSSLNLKPTSETGTAYLGYKGPGAETVRIGIYGWKRSNKLKLLFLWSYCVLRLSLEARMLMLMIVFDSVVHPIWDSQRCVVCRDDMCVVMLQKQDLCLYCVLALLVMLLLSHCRRCKLSVWAGPLIQSLEWTGWNYKAEGTWNAIL